MTTKTEKLAAEIQDLTDGEKLRLVDEILSDLDKPDPEIDHIWAEEARKRWTATRQAIFSRYPIRKSWTSIADHVRNTARSLVNLFDSFMYNVIHIYV